MQRSHLVPTVITDVNGRTTTVHKRRDSDDSVASLTPVKVPAIAPQSVVTAQTEPIEFRVATYDFDAYHDIYDHGTYRDLDHWENFAFTASGDEFYSVMSIASPGNGLALLEMGYRSDRDAISYLKERELTGLVIDRSGFIDDLRARGITPKQALESKYFDTFLPSSMETHKDSPWRADAVEFSTIEDFQHNHQATKFENLIFTGKIKLQDIKDVGIDYLRVGNLTRLVSPYLQRLANNEDVMSAHNMRRFLAVYDSGTQLGEREFKMLTDLADTEDIEAVESIVNVAVFYDHLRNTTARIDGGYANPSPVVSQAAVRLAFYQTRLRETLERENVDRGFAWWMNDYCAESTLLHSHDAAVNETAQLMKQGLNARQIVGRLNNIEIALVDGWL